MKLKLFISYATKDEIFCDELDTHLALLKRQGFIDTWAARDIISGTDRARIIDNNLKTADIILLLISPDFIASDYCYDTELTQAIERHRQAQSCVIPVILRPCDWKSAPFSELQPLPIASGEGVKPLTRWENRDEAFLAIAQGIRRVAEELNVVLAIPKAESQKEESIEEIRSRSCKRILAQHSMIQLLNQTQIMVDQLYVDVWLLNRSPRTFLVSEDKMLKSFDLRNDRLGLGDRISRNEGMTVADENDRLLILGKPGAGKTTFLKHLAVDCSKDKFQSDLIPVLIELRRIQSENWKLLDAISEQLELDSQQTQKLLAQGKLLILMDGLDEVPTSSFRRNVQEQVRDLAQQPQHAGNRFVLTCRTQIIETIPQGFTSVEVADFNLEQVKTFVENWFRASGVTEIAQQWQAFSEVIETNAALKELTVTPVLLSLMCWVFQDSGELPSQAAMLYRKGIRLLLEKWNDRKEISGWEIGDEVYRKLSLDQKERLLTEIAAWKFENPGNFVLFEQEVLAKQIAKLLKLARLRDGVAVLRAIEAQHGLLLERADELWSFSHLTFQEHFTIQWLTQLSPEQLAKKIANPQWQKVVKQLVKSQPSDRLLKLIKQATDYSVSQDIKLQKFLTWVQKKTESLSPLCKSAAIRAFYFAPDFARVRIPEYFALDRDLESELELARDRAFAYDLDFALERDRALTFALALDLALTRNLALACARINEHNHALHNLEPALDFALRSNRERDRTLVLELARDLARVRDLARDLARDRKAKLANQVQKLRLELPKDFSGQTLRIFRSWWRGNGQDWIEALRQVMIEHRNIGHDWQFTKAQKQSLQKYYDANKFLVELLSQEGAVSQPVRQEIEDNLLLPIATLRERLPEMYGREESRE
ncbi:NACHT domain-containing protein [Leptolyngbya boryana CZ1]|uniref:NACHT domain-containing protein n=1 Tax=Leptolyngbya boryana CZ1 TaxID=3060204 RepID=A0AA96WTT7_LEPBY|nr:NACHT domain-containing protein [Leptolyngbya boryana]WNZ45531.1 NACHT domain-containing protein [Leptolyngbya boryana CZ1]